MSDYMIRGIAAEDQVRFFAAYTKDTAEFARQAHNLSPICTAALGRLLTAGAMMGAMMKEDEDLLTLKIDCNGPIGGLSVTADRLGGVKGYVKNPDVILPATENGKLNVGGALDLGVLSVIRDTGLKEPYVGQTILVSGEIAEDITYYFATSEQTPSSVALGVLMNRDNTVRTAGGFIIQLLPGTKEETIALLEERIAGLHSVTAMLDSGLTPEGMMEQLFAGLDMKITERTEVAFRCGCSREKTADMLRSLPKEELLEMAAEEKDTEVVCHYCGKCYSFSPAELTEMVREKETAQH
ncbi:MAG: Hsp33 family molecular chaperone HslO [Lachnospiraceae bacterium]|nr:Hsp33 family molecular chaperone HslO [Lachnospiraceae bacterium]